MRRPLGRTPGALSVQGPADGKAQLSLLLDHVEGREGQAVADPYYGEADHFDLTWRDVAAGAEGLARRIAAEA